MASWAAGAGRCSGGVVGAIVPPKKKVPEFTLMHYVANNCKYDFDSEASSSEESVGALKAANDRRVNETLEQAREHLMMRDEFPSDDEEDVEGRKKALEMIHKMEYMRNQKDTWKVLAQKTSRENEKLSLHPLQRNDDEEYFSGTQKAKSKVRKRNRPSETVVLDEGFFQQPEVSGPQGAPPGVQAPKVKVPSTGLPFKPGPPLPKNSNPWMQRSGADLFSAAQSRTIVAYGVTVRNEEEALALAIAESIRTANEEKNRHFINLAPPVNNEPLDLGWNSDPPQVKRVPPDPPCFSWDTDVEEEPKRVFCPSKETKEKDLIKSANKTKAFDEFSFHSDKPLEFIHDPVRVQNASCTSSTLRRSKEGDLMSTNQKKAFDDHSFQLDESLDFEEPHDMKKASFDKVKIKKEMAYFRPLQNNPQQLSSDSFALEKKSELPKQNSDFSDPVMSTISLPPRQRTKGRSIESPVTSHKMTQTSSGSGDNVPAKSAASDFDMPSPEKESIPMHDSEVVIQKEVLKTNQTFISSEEKPHHSSKQFQHSETNPCELSSEEVVGDTCSSKGTSLFSKEAAQSMKSPAIKSPEAVEQPKIENGMKPKMSHSGDGNRIDTNQDTSGPMLRGSALQYKPSRLPKSFPVAPGAGTRFIPTVKESSVLENHDSSVSTSSDVSEAQQFLKFETGGMEFPASIPNQNLLESIVNNNMQGIEAMKLNVSSSNITPAIQDILTNMYATQVMPQNFGLPSQSAQDKQGMESPTSKVLPPFGQQNMPHFSPPISQCPPFMAPELMAQIMPQMMLPVLQPQFPQMVPQMAPQMSPDVVGNMAMYQMALQKQYEQQLQQAMACYGLPQMGQIPSEMSPSLIAMQGQGTLGSSQLKGQPVAAHGLGSLLKPASLVPSAETRPGLTISPPGRGRGRLRPSMLQ